MTNFEALLESIQEINASEEELTRLRKRLLEQARRLRDNASRDEAIKMLLALPD